MKENSENLAQKDCIPCRKGDPVLAETEVAELLESLTEWQLNTTKIEISRRFEFKDFTQTMWFVNELAKISDANDHHPDVHFGYNYCLVGYSTHAIKGLSENDFICAAKVDLVFDHV